MHFFSPANIMRLVEIVRGREPRRTRSQRSSRSHANLERSRGRRQLPRLRRQPHARRGRRRPSGCCSKARCRRRSTRRWSSSASRWARCAVERSRRPRHRLADAKQARAGGTRRDRRCALRARPLRPEDGRGLLSLRAGLARATSRSGSRGSSSATVSPARHRASRDRRRRDHRAAPLPPDQRGRAHPRRRHCRALQRHRCDLGLWLRLSASGTADRCTTPTTSV